LNLYFIDLLAAYVMHDMHIAMSYKKSELMLMRCATASV